MIDEKVIFSKESTFHVLKRKNQRKIWRLEKETFLLEYIQQINSGDGRKVTATNIYKENMDGKLDSDVLQRFPWHEYQEKSNFCFSTRPIL